MYAADEGLRGQNVLQSVVALKSVATSLYDIKVSRILHTVVT